MTSSTTEQKLPQFSLQQLFDSGVHFGHKASRWNPKMGPYIYDVKEGIHIIDLQKTLMLFRLALKVVYDTVRKNGSVLFVGTKLQSSDLVAEYIENCGQYYVNYRWLGGMLTNWNTISKSIKDLDRLEKSLNDENVVTAYTKKEVLEMTRKKEKLLRSFAGIRNLNKKPDLLVVLDAHKEGLAITEARKLNIPIVAVVDTNADPDNIDYLIPGNDDSVKSIRLYLHLFSQAVLKGVEDSLAAAGVDLGAAVDGRKSKSSFENKTGKFKQHRKVNKVSNVSQVSANEQKSKVRKTDEEKPKIKIDEGKSNAEIHKVE